MREPRAESAMAAPSYLVGSVGTAARHKTFSCFSTQNVYILDKRILMITLCELQTVKHGAIKSKTVEITKSAHPKSMAILNPGVVVRMRRGGNTYQIIFSLPICDHLHGCVVTRLC